MNNHIIKYWCCSDRPLLYIVRVSYDYNQNIMFISSLQMQQQRFQILQNFLGKIKTWLGERWRVASRLIKYATIISVPTVARSPFPSLRDAAKRSLFGLTDEESAARERWIFREEIGAPWCCDSVTLYLVKYARIISVHF